MLTILGLLHMASSIFENPVCSLLAVLSSTHMLHFSGLKTELLQNSFQVKLIRNCSVLTYTDGLATLECPTRRCCFHEVIVCVREVAIILLILTLLSGLC